MARRFDNIFFMCVIACCCAFLGGCRKGPSMKKPTIVFDQVPPVEPGDVNGIGSLRGHVVGAQAGQRIVLYALGAGTWWIQPVTVHPYTDIAPDGTWRTFTHMGARYAALLVNPGFVPLNQLKELPAEDAGVAALATVAPAKSAVPTQHIRFSNYEWEVRQMGSDRNGSPHNYEPANVTVDARGFLHLLISRGPDGWNCSEVALPRSLGYGTYAFSVSDITHLDPAAVFSMFTWDTSGTDQDRREVDSVVSRWGNPKGSNAQYIVQPFFRPANTFRYVVPAGLSTYSFLWAPGKITFRTVQGADSQAKKSVITEHTFTSEVPTPRTESIHINLCTFDYTPVPQQQPAEIIVQRFQFLP